MAKSISYLLGAGFSAPAGYPIGNILNNKLLKCNEDKFTFHSSGVLVPNNNGQKPNFGVQSSHETQFEFCVVLMNLFYNRMKYFDYEEFYDFMLNVAIKDAQVHEIAKPFVSRFGAIEQLFFGLPSIYQQVVAYYIHDHNGKQWYDDEPYTVETSFEGYTGFLNYLVSSTAAIDSVNIHTLNHDLFFERLGKTKWLTGNLCDGFEEAGSPFYGTLESNGKLYRQQLPRYTGKYESKFKLYKLHGSLSYGAFFKSSQSGILKVPEIYIKTRYGVGFGEIEKETIAEGKTTYDRDFTTYHSDFLTGTTSKVKRYREPLLYTKLLALFVKNLKVTESLVIVGYGCRDSEINRLILENFDFNNKACYIIDPFAGDSVKEFAKRINGRIISTPLNDITTDDFNSI